MLTGMRKGLGRFGATIILAPLIVAFAIWGIGDVFKGSVKDSVASVNGKGIGEREFLSGFDRAVRRLNQQAQQQGQHISADEARKRGFDKALLNEMIVSEALAQAAQKLGLTISDRALASQIRALPAFQDGLKRFDPKTYERMLSEVGYTRKSFETELRSDLIRSQLGAAASAGAYLPATFLVQELKLRSETRTVKLVKVPGSAIPNPPTPSEPEIKTFYDQQGGELYAVPEYRSATLVLARINDFTAKVSVPEDQIKTQLDQRKNEFSSPEKRTFRQLPVADALNAQIIVDRAKKGESLAMIASALKIDAPLTFSGQTKNEIADANVAEAVFAAKPGAVLGPITGSLGAKSIVVLDTVIPGSAFDEAKARAQVRGELAEEQAKELMFKALENLEDATAGGATLDKAAQKAGLMTLTLPPIDRQGLTAQREPVEALVPEKIRTALFATPEGEHSDSDSLEDGSYFVVQTNKIQAADKQPLTAVKGDVIKRLLAQKRAEVIKAKADAFIALAASKGGLEKAAVAEGLKIIERSKPLKRGETDQVINQYVAGAIFGGELKQVVAGPAADGGFIAAEIEAITREDPRAHPEIIAKIQASAFGKFGGEIANAYQAAVLARSKVETDRYKDRFDRINGRGGAEQE